MTRLTAIPAAIATAIAAGIAAAQGMPPWTPSGIPLAEEVKSVEVVRRDEPLFTAPDVKSPRRGAAALGARLPIFGAAGAGPESGCKTEFLLVGPTAWICGEATRATTELPNGKGFGAPAGEDGLPRSYYFVGADGALGYPDLARAEQMPPSAELQPGFAVALTRIADGPGGEPYGLTTKQLWLPLRNLSKIKPSLFRGYEARGALDRGWVVADRTEARESPNGKRVRSEPRRRFDVVPVLEVRETTLRSTQGGAGKGRAWVRVSEGEWLDGRDVRLPRLAEPPVEARPFERWIDVDLENQIVTAYEGASPVFTTLVSTGVGHESSETATPKGVHRVWAKLSSTDMTNLENEEALRYYAMQEVPWVLFFRKGYGLHGAFWHSSFGRVRSHGCVNLTPLDARRLFDWAGPHLPAGWTAVLPTDYDPGTLVRVR